MGKRIAKKDKQTFALTLKAWRERERFTQAQAAAELGIPVRTLQNWEIARTMPQGFGYTALLYAISPPKRRRA